MQIENIIINEYLENNSFITTKQAESMGISRHILSLMAKEEKIKRVKHGIYTKNDKVLDILSLNTKKLIFSYESALFLNNYISKEEKNIHVTVPQGYNVNRFKKKAKNIIFHYVNVDTFEKDKVEVLTKENNKVFGYSIERTCLDIYNRDKNFKLLKKIFMKLDDEKKKSVKDFFKKYTINIDKVL